MAEKELATKAAATETMSSKVHDFQATRQAQAVALASMASHLARLRGDHKALKELVSGDFIGGTLDGARASQSGSCYLRRNKHQKFMFTIHDRRRPMM